MGELPRALQGYALGQRLALNNEQNQLGALHGALALRSAQQEDELWPLKVAQLQQKVQEGALSNALLQHISKRFQGGPASPDAVAAATSAPGQPGPTLERNAMLTAGGPAGGMGGPGGASGLEPPLDIQAMFLHPLTKDLGKTLGEAYKPTPEMRNLTARGVAPGSPQWNSELGTRFTQSGAWRIGANGGVELDPGYAAGQGAIKAAEAGAQAPFNIKDRKIGGRDYQMSDADFAAYYGADPDKSAAVAQRFGLPVIGRPQPAPPQPEPAAAPPAQDWRTGRSPQEIAAIEAVRAARGAPTTANVPAPQPGAPIPTWRVVGPPQNPTAGERAAQETSAKNDADLVSTYRQKIPSLNSTLNRLNRLEALNTDDQTYAAAGAEFKTQLGSIAQSLGLNIAKDKTANSEVYLAQIGELMKDRLGSKDYGSGSGVSNLDLISAKQPLPELAKTQQGRQAIIEAIRTDTQNSLRDMNSARTFFEKNMSLNGFQFPSEVAQQVQQTRPGPARATPAGGSGSRKVIDFGAWR